MIIYLTTNLINNKIYVGQDSYDNPNYYGSGKILNRAIKKYGKNNFKKEILQRCKNPQELNEAEIYWIDKLKATDDTIGYNISLGGTGRIKGSKLTEEHIKNISHGQTLQGYIDKHGLELGTKKYNKKIINQSEAQQERLKDEVERMKYSASGKLNGMYGRNHSKETLQKISKKNKGKKHTQETKDKWSETRKGKDNGMYGKGYLLSGANNGRAKEWILISSDNKIFQVDDLVTFCSENNLSCELLRRYKDDVIPKDLKIRGSNLNTIQRRNTLGWSLSEDLKE